jgi:hypothetical protein
VGDISYSNPKNGEMTVDAPNEKRETEYKLD